jgi:hypothetical protein
MISLFMIIIVCSIISVTCYPRKTNEPFVNILTFPQFFLLVKNFAYNSHAIKNFYSYNNSGITTLNSLALPTFFAIAPLCSEVDINTNYNCLDYNINNISIENKTILNSGLKMCSSVDNFTGPTDALAYTLRIKDDTFSIHKNCFLAEEIKILDKPTIQSQARDLGADRIIESLASAGISNQFQNEALLLAQYSDNTTDPEYNTEYTIQIKGTKLCKFIVLSRPLFMKIGMSGLYKINYASNAVGNTINNYTSDNETDDTLKLKIRRVCDKRIFPTNTLTIEKAIDILNMEAVSNIDCKPTNILNTSNGYVQNTPAQVVPVVSARHYTTMLYYLTHSQHIDNPNSSLTSCITVFFNQFDYSATEKVIFAFSSSNISTMHADEIFTIKINNFGVTNEEYQIINPDVGSVSILCTWSDNRLNFAIFYTKSNTLHLTFRSLETTIGNCSFIKAAFAQACIDYRCTLAPGKATTFVSMHDIALSRNFI